ncbi:MAG: hypothetical protein AVDCRST_MAG41-4172, partial [uncultured Corynebacteriales bacterium]
AQHAGADPAAPPRALRPPVPPAAAGGGAAAVPPVRHQPRHRAEPLPRHVRLRGQGVRPRAAGVRRAAGRQRVGVPGDAGVRDGQRGGRGRLGRHRRPGRRPGAHRHAAPGGDGPRRGGVAAGDVPAGGAAGGGRAGAGPVRQPGRRRAAGRARRGDQAGRHGQRARAGRDRAARRADVRAGGHPERHRRRPGPAPAAVRRAARGDPRARPERGGAARRPDPGRQRRARRRRRAGGVRHRPRAAGRAGRGRAGCHGGGGRFLPGRRGEPAARRGVPPQPADADRLGRRLGGAQPVRAAVGPAPDHGHRDPAPLQRQGVGRGDAGPAVPLRGGPAGVRAAGPGPAGGGEGRPRLRGRAPV